MFKETIKLLLQKISILSGRTEQRMSQVPTNFNILQSSQQEEEMEKEGEVQCCCTFIELP